MQCDVRNVENWRHSTATGHRGSKWDNVLLKVYGGDWQELSKEKEWSTTFNRFAREAFTSMGLNIPRGQDTEVKRTIAVRCTREIPPEKLVQWTNYGSMPGFEVVGDNQDVVNWIDGQASCKDNNYKACVLDLTTKLHEAWKQSLIAPRQSP